MSALELKVPPPAVALAIAGLMWGVERCATAFAVEAPEHSLISALIAAVGLALSISGVVTFRRAKTTVNPTTPSASSSLVDWGVYKMTRNPMYLGLLFILIGWAVFLSNALAALLLLPTYVLYINQFQIVPEERALTSLFGRDYIAYQSRVRRWL
jgi:protein-S-isoprenylcysteine O-methyltransferase Ste14